MTPPILLTGLPRSGTTWASSTVATALRARLVHEPFNWKRFPDREPFHMQYRSATDQDDALVKILERSIRWTIRPLFSPRVVIKDVHICLAAEYVEQALGAKIIIIARHPCGMALSWNALGLKADFRVNLLLSQPRLVERFLAPFADHMRGNADPFFQIGAYWGASYYILDALGQHGRWHWITHEALCQQPEAAYWQLLSSVVPESETAVRQRLQTALAATNRPGSRQDGVLAINRVSQQEPDKWRSRLSAEQQTAVLAGAAPFQLVERLFGTDAE